MSVPRESAQQGRRASLVELRCISHGYERFVAGRVGYLPVLQEVTLQVDRGQIVGICGPSGSGKSTLLRIAGGLERPRTGEVIADGMQIWGRSSRPSLPRPGWVGMLFQNPAASLDPSWQIGLILDEPFKARGRIIPDREEQLRQRQLVLTEVGLDGLSLRIFPRQLSIGQQQRVALARLLLAAPDLIVADEPTSALDMTNSAAVMHILDRTARSGAGILLVSHDLAMLMAVCDQVWRCDDGHLIAA